METTIEIPREWILRRREAGTWAVSVSHKFPGMVVEEVRLIEKQKFEQLLSAYNALKKKIESSGE